MRISFLHLSDFHLNDSKGIHPAKIQAIVDSLGVYAPFEGIVIVLSGDIAATGPVAVHRDRVCKLRVVELVEQSPVGLIRISVVDHEPVHPLEIWIIKLALGQGQTSSSLFGGKFFFLKSLKSRRSLRIS